MKIIVSLHNSTEMCEIQRVISVDSKTKKGMVTSYKTVIFIPADNNHAYYTDVTSDTARMIFEKLRVSDFIDMSLYDVQLCDNAKLSLMIGKE